MKCRSNTFIALAIITFCIGDFLEKNWMAFLALSFAILAFWFTASEREEDHRRGRYSGRAD